MRIRSIWMRIIRDMPRVASLCISLVAAATMVSYVIPVDFWPTDNGEAVFVFTMNLACIGAAVLAYGPRLEASRRAWGRLVLAGLLFDVAFVYSARPSELMDTAAQYLSSVFLVICLSALVVQLVSILVRIPAEMRNRRPAWMASELCVGWLLVMYYLVGTLGSESVSENLGGMALEPALYASGWVVILMLAVPGGTTDWRLEQPSRLVEAP